MIQAQQVQRRRVKVMGAWTGFSGGLVAEVVGGPVGPLPAAESRRQPAESSSREDCGPCPAPTFSVPEFWIIGVRPNSLPTITSVSSSIPRSFKSSIKDAIGPSERSA